MTTTVWIIATGINDGISVNVDTAKYIDVNGAAKSVATQLSNSTTKQYRSIHNCCFNCSSQQELGMTTWKRSSNSNFAAIPQQSSKSDMLWGLLTNPHLQMLWLLMPKYVVEPTGQSQYVLDGGSLVHRIPWQRGTTYNDICRQYTNYVTRRYGYAIVVFDGYQEELSTKDGAYERRNGGRAGPTVDFTRDMVMKSKKEDLLSNKDNKQRFIRMLGQSLEHVGCETRHAKGDADVLIVETTVQYTTSCKTTWLAMTRICLRFCIFMSRKSLAKCSSNQRSDPEQRRAHDAGTSSMCKECWDVQFATICCLLMPSSAVI